MSEIITKKKRTKSVIPDTLKIPPHAFEAEQSILGGLMLDNQAWDTIHTKVCAEDFYRYEHRLLFNVMRELAQRNQPFDVITIMDALKTHDNLNDAGGEAYLFEIANNTPSVANISAYADIVREKSVHRQLIAVSNEIADAAFHSAGRTITELLDFAETKVFAIAEQTGTDGGPEAIKHILVQTIERIDALYHSKEAIIGLASGFKDFDNMTSGLQKSELIIIAGRPSMGKTVLGMNIAEQASIRHRKPVLVFSMEMPADALAMRMISSLGRIDKIRVRTGQVKEDDWSRITSAVELLSQTPLFIDDTPGLSPAELRARARRVAKEQGQLGLIVIDYLQLMQIPGMRVENRTAEISEISRSLKSLAKELNVPVIALSQLNRSLEQRADKRPIMSDLRESGAIEQDADLIIFIYRDEVYHPESPDAGTAEIIIAKQRNGPIGKVKLKFFGEFTKFEDLAYEGYQSLA